MDDPGERKKPEYIVFGQPKLTEEEIAAVATTLRSGWIGTGPKTKEFEAEFAAYQGAAHAAAVSSCTAALTLSLRAFGIGPGDEVITTAMTFAATVNAIIHTGATPVLVDVHPGTMTIDPELVEAAITARTKAVIPVHFAGLPADMDALLALRRKYGFKLVHDCAHAIETRWKGKPLGSFGDAACYSFYSTKNITTIEGGMVCSEDRSFLELVGLLSYQGMSKTAWKRYSNHGFNHYDIIAGGLKLNMTDVQATIGLLQLKSLEERLQRRERVWQSYQNALSTTPLRLPVETSPANRHARHLYTVLVDPRACGFTRDDVISGLHDRMIGSGAHYRSIPTLSYYHEHFKWDAKDYPNAYTIGETTVSLPISPYMTDPQVERVIEAVTELFSSTASLAA